MIPDPSAAPDLVGRTLGDFLVRAPIGEGGQGIVYRAEQPALGREAVIKVIREQGELAPRFLREARLASKLDHPYAAHVYAFGAEPDGLLWIAMELVRGTPLDKVLAAQGPMPIERFVPFFERLCEVVHTAHEQGIVHRDLKPANVMVVARAGRIMPKLLDLGIAKRSDTVEDDAPALDSLPVADPGLTQRGEIVGSPRYMAPEQWMNAPTIDGRTDIYALGVLAYEVLTGQRPFAGTTMKALARAHAKSPVPPLGDRFPPALHDVLAKSMAKKQADRHATALDLAAAVRAGAGLEAEREALPRLDEETRAAALTDLPFPIAEAVAALDAARHGHQARDAVWEIGATLCLYLGTLALACRSRLAQRPDSDLLVALTRRGLSDVEWLELVRQLCRPYARERDLFPIPELVGFALDGAGELEALVAAERSGSFSEEQLRPILTRQLASLGRTLRALGFLADYPLVTMREQAVEAWMGTRRRSWSASRVEEGEVAILDHAGSPILRLSPLVQPHEPTPGAGFELFFFAGKGRRGARLVAPPRGFERHDEAFWGWFRQSLFTGGDDTAAEIVEAAPYRGLASFSRDDAALFFGREAETEAFRNRLRVTPLLAVVGPSGAGKSSFVEAGVVPSLGEGWRVISMRPGPTPLATLEARLATASGQTLLVVDQFEELFTLGAGEHERRAFAARLVGAARDPLRIVLTLRDDFLIRATELGAFRERIGQGLQLLTTPAREDLLRILTLPAERAGYRFEEVDLPGKMVDAVAGQPGALALLSFTASRLWELRDRHFKQLPRKAYEALGGVAGALAQHAEAVRAALAPDEQRLVRDAFRALVTAEGTRAVLGKGELKEILGDTPAAGSVVDHLVDARLLVTREGESGPTIEVIHEALLSSWPRLVDWRREDAEGARLRDQLRAAARQWDERGRAAGLLWRGEALAEYERWRPRYPGQLAAVESAFGDASVGDARRSRRNRRLLVAAAFAALSAALVVALFLNRRATVARGDAEEKTIQLLQDQGRQYMLANDPIRAYPYLLAAWERGGPNPALRHLFGRVERQLGTQRAVLRHRAHINEVELDPSDRHVVTASGDGTAKIWSVPDGVPEHTLGGHGGAVIALAISPSGATVATGDAQGTIRLWDLASGELQRTLSGHRGTIRHLAWTSDDRVLASASEDTTARVWDVATGQTLQTVTHGRDWANFVWFPAGDRELWSVSRDGGVVVTKLGGASRELVHLPRGAGWLATSRSGNRVAITSDDHVAIYDRSQAAFLPEVRGFVDGPTLAEISPDGTLLAALSTGDTGILVTLDGARQVIPLEGHTAGVEHLAFSTDGAWLATGSADGSVKIREARTGRVLTTLVGHTDRVRRVRFSHDGSIVATASFDGTGRLWSPRHPDVVRTIAAHTDTVLDLDYDASGERLLSSGLDGVVRMWNPQTGAKLLELPVEAANAMIRVRFSPSGKRAAVAHIGETLVVDTSTSATIARKATESGVATPAFGRTDEELFLGTEAGEIVTLPSATPWRAQPSAIVALALTPDGETLLAVDSGSASLWTSRGVLLRRFGETSLVLRDGRFSPDRRHVLLISGGRSPEVWSTERGERELSLEGHTDALGAGTYAAEGRLIVTTGFDATLRVWDAASGALLTTSPLAADTAVALASAGTGVEVAVGLGNGVVWIWTLADAPPGWTPSACHVPYVLTADLQLAADPRCQ